MCVHANAGTILVVVLVMVNDGHITSLHLDKRLIALCFLLVGVSRAQVDFEVENGPLLRQFVEGLAVNGLVVTTVANDMAVRAHHERGPNPARHHGLLPEWLKGVRQHNITNFFVACYDQEASLLLAAVKALLILVCSSQSALQCYDTLQQQGTPAWLLNISDIGAAHHWVAIAKSQLCRDLVALGFAVLFSDADVLFLGNPIDSLVKDRDLESSTDAFGWSGYIPAGNAVQVQTPSYSVHFYALPQLNAGFFFVQPSQKMAAVLHQWYLWVSNFCC